MKSFLRIVSVLCSLQIVSAFVAPTNIAQVAPSIMTPTSTFSQLNLAPIDTDTLNTIVNNAPSMMLSETEPWVEPLSQILGPFFNIFSFFMLCRVVISWYPTSNLNEFPYNVVVWPTEPLLRAIRGTVPPAFGVDITPIVWLAIFSFFNEILCGQQGLLTMKMKYGI
ncbi:hypothetical protein CTEN210_03243 [Chaetoceros tenuissimus]|uniref:Uncharacterized protein n=1 Tax=Chaetoceros tenuissimus TaxID=426638 RepID=A0AAD3CL57_9STRA|nr:hypothetical protein CTEN210_03243 [Chaetoceros tenuissimus]